MKPYKILLFILFVILSTNLCFAQKQTHSVVVSSGYGFPSILRFILKLEKKQDIVNSNIGGLGPFHEKIEYIYKQRVGLGASFFYNTLHFNFSNKLLDTFRYQVRDHSLIVRANFYAINTQKQQLYVGFGLGHIWFNNFILPMPGETDTFYYYLYKTPALIISNKKVWESTIGYRRFIYKNLGVYGEFGIGRTIKQFTKNGAIDSYFQIGASYIFRRKNKEK